MIIYGGKTGRDTTRHRRAWKRGFEQNSFPRKTHREYWQQRGWLAGGRASVTHTTFFTYFCIAWQHCTNIRVLHREIFLFFFGDGFTKFSVRKSTRLTVTGTIVATVVLFLVTSWAPWVVNRRRWCWRCCHVYHFPLGKILRHFQF